jgi:16S rRNA (uracil1498-N3)-methyltransferase
MEYFYTPPSLVSSSHLVIEGDEFSHLTHVMRKKVGDAVRVVDGSGMAYDVVIDDIEKRSARCEITARHDRLNEPEADVTLAVAVLKNFSRFDFLVEKVTELGVNTIVPLLTERTIPRHAKVERWQKLALAAMKQSGRCALPAVKELTRFTDLLDSTPKDSLKLIPHEKASATTVSEVVKHRTLRPVMVCIGPEGGFSDEEIGRAMRAGFIPVYLGTRRLRTETAAIVSVAFLLETLNSHKS